MPGVLLSATVLSASSEFMLSLKCHSVEAEHSCLTFSPYVVFQEMGFDARTYLSLCNKMLWNNRVCMDCEAEKHSLWKLKGEAMLGVTELGRGLGL